jgi:hypothetical protein
MSLSSERCMGKYPGSVDSGKAALKKAPRGAFRFSVIRYEWRYDITNYSKQ